MIYEFLVILDVAVGSSIIIYYLISYFFSIYIFASAFFLGCCSNLRFNVLTISRLKCLLLLVSFIGPFDSTAYYTAVFLLSLFSTSFSSFNY